MKARIENGQIVTYKYLPRVFSGITGTYPGKFDTQNTEVHEAEGFLDVIKPEIDTDIQKLGDIYFDQANNIFTYPVVNKVLNLEEIRAQKHKQFTQIIEGEMTDALKIGILEKLAMGEVIPQETKDKVTALRAREAGVKTLIDSIQDATTLVKFSFDRVEIEADKEELKAARKL